MVTQLLVKRVGEDRTRLAEADPVPLLVAPLLAWIPLEPDRHAGMEALRSQDVKRANESRLSGGRLPARHITLALPQRTSPATHPLEPRAPARCRRWLGCDRSRELCQLLTSQLEEALGACPDVDRDLVGLLHWSAKQLGVKLR